MSDKTSNDVGYGKPPKAGRFQKGKSGNPKGRPRGTKNLATEIFHAVRQTVPVKQEGRSVRMTKLQVTIQQLVNKAAQGDTRAVVEVLDRVADLEAKAEARTNDTATFTDADRAVILEIYRRLSTTKTELSLQEKNDD